MAAEPFDYIMNGEILTGLISAYTRIMGNWFFVFLALAIIGAVQFKGRQAESTGLAMIILGSMGTAGTVGGWLTRFPGSEATGGLAVGIVWVLIALAGLSLILYKWFKK